jgi:hypothetical protein
MPVHCLFVLYLPIVLRCFCDCSHVYKLDTLLIYRHVIYLFSLTVCNPKPFRPASSRGLTRLTALEAGTGFSAKKPGLDLNIIFLGDKFKVCSSHDSLNSQQFWANFNIFPHKIYL